MADIDGVADTGQASQSVFGRGLSINAGSATTSQSASSSFGSGGLELLASGSTGQSQSVTAYGAVLGRELNKALYRLIKYPHSAVFDKDSYAEAALTISCSQPITWSISAGVLRITVGVLPFEFGLEKVTVAQLAVQLSDIGIDILETNGNLAQAGAHILLDASGEQAFSDIPTRLMAFTADLWSLFSAYSVDVDEAGNAIPQAIKQMVITQAEGEWLDLWGELFNHPRPPTVNDEIYAPQIPKEAFRIRVNALAIEQAILDATGKDVRIEEPWETMFRLSESALSGGDRFYNGDSVGYHIIRPVSQSSIDWSDVLPVIERNRAAGVIPLQPEVRLGFLVDGGVLGAVSIMTTSTYSTRIQSSGEGRLSYMVLSSGEYERNYGVMISALSTHSLLGNQSPVSASMQAYAISGLIWRDENVWGDFTWGAEGVTVAIIGTDVDSETSVGTVMIDYVDAT